MAAKGPAEFLPKGKDDVPDSRWRVARTIKRHTIHILRSLNTAAAGNVLAAFDTLKPPFGAFHRLTTPADCGRTSRLRFVERLSAALWDSPIALQVFSRRPLEQNDRPEC
jgi:hypothetical protein